MKKIIILLFALSFNLTWIMAQKSTITGEAIVGQPCPDVFFQKTINFNKRTLYLHELKGKWVILDLWSMHCSACVGSFPHVSEKQTKFRDKVQFLMGTYDDPEGKNAAIYTHFNKMLNLQMPCVFAGTSETKPTDLFKKFKVGALPFVVIIDPSGIVRAVTVTVNEAQIQALINGESPKFADAPYSDNRNNIKKAQYNPAIPFLIDGNGSSGVKNEFNYRSIMAGGNTQIPPNYVMKFTRKSRILDNSPGRLEGLSVGLSNLYCMAYFGEFNTNNLNNNENNVGMEDFKNGLDTSALVWQYPIFELKDTSEFVSDGLTGKNLFSYSLIVPPADGTKEKMMKVMQDDLKRYFKYDAKLEIRLMPCWRLIISDSTLAHGLRTKGGKYENSEPIPRISRKAVNVPIGEFDRVVKHESGLEAKPFIDDTKIDYNIDIYYEHVPDDIESLNSALKKVGLSIVKEKKALRVLVIRDPIPL